MMYPGNKEPCGGATQLTVYKGVADAIEIEPVSGWVYLACWTDIVSDRTLPSTVLNNPHITPPLATQFCEGYDFFGLENGNEAWCGNTIDPKDPKASSELQCLTPCGGDLSWRYSGAERMNLYKAVHIHVLETWHMATPDTDDFINWSWDALHVFDANANPTIDAPCTTSILQSDADPFGGADKEPPKRVYDGLEGGCEYTPEQADGGVGRFTCANGINVLCFMKSASTLNCGLRSMVPGVICHW
jgi:hypothetical protein